MFRKLKNLGSIFSPTGTPFSPPRKMVPPGRAGQNTNFLICLWIFMYDSSLFSYFNGENISVTKIQQKIIPTPLKG